MSAMNNLQRLCPLAVAAATILAAVPTVSVSQVRAVATVTKPAAVAAPQGLAVTPTNGGPQLTWQKSPDAGSYRVLRAASGATAAIVIATLPAATLMYLDRGFAGKATYQVVTVASDGRTAASAAVSYTSPIATIGVAGTVGLTSLVPAKPAMTYVGSASVLTIGDTIPVSGTGLSPIGRLVLVAGCYYGSLPLQLCNSWPCAPTVTCHPNPNNVQATLTAITSSPTGFSFALSPWFANAASLPPGSVLADTYFLIVNTPGGSDTSRSFKLRTRAP